MYDQDNVSVIQRSRAERKKLGIKRTNIPSKPVSLAASKPEPKEDIVEEILQGVSKVEPDTTENPTTVCPSGDLGVEGDPGVKEGSHESVNSKPVKKKAVKKPRKKKTTSRGKNVKVEDLNREELSDLFTSPTATVDDDDDDE